MFILFHIFSISFQNLVNFNNVVLSQIRIKNIQQLGDPIRNASAFVYSSNTFLRIHCSPNLVINRINRMVSHNTVNKVMSYMTILAPAYYLDKKIRRSSNLRSQTRYFCRVLYNVGFVFFFPYLSTGKTNMASIRKMKVDYRVSEAMENRRYLTTPLGSLYWIMATNRIS